MLNHFFLCSERIIKDGGHVSFEWPKNCEGWQEESLLKFIKKHDMYEALCDGCALGLVDKNGDPHLKHGEWLPQIGN